MAISSLRILTELHNAVGVVVVNAGLAKGVDADGRPVAPPRIVVPKGPATRGSPFVPP